MKKIVLATTNRGKLKEIKSILSLPEVEILSLKDLSFNDEIEENGSTFLENALLKAQTVFNAYGLPVLADDSGICVDFLGGKPGVFSARFAGSGATDEKNNELLLKKLSGVTWEKRTARFVCYAVLYVEKDKYYSAQGTVEGVVAQKPAGENGFGYDPLFFIPHLNKTMAQLPSEIKNSISHRAKAFMGLKPYIVKHLFSCE